MKWEMLGEQAVRVGLECARRGGVHENDVDDCAMSFLHRKFGPEDLYLPAWQEEKANKLERLRYA